jgi:hypothetical protein
MVQVRCTRCDAQCRNHNTGTREAQLGASSEADGTLLLVIT